MLIKPSKSSIKDFLKTVRDTTKANKTATKEGLIHLLNPKIRGWANYYRHAVSKKTFRYIDHNIFQSVVRWIRRRHPKKTLSGVGNKYFRHNGSRNWIFYAKAKAQGKSKYLDLIHAAKMPIKRHVKIKGSANPYDPSYREYFNNRKIRKIISYKAANNDLDKRDQQEIAGFL